MTEQENQELTPLNHGMSPQCAECRKHLRLYVLEQFDRREERYGLELENIDTKVVDSTTAIQTSLNSGKTRMDTIDQDIKNVHTKIEDGWKEHKFPWFNLLVIFVPTVVVIAGAIILMFADIKVMESKCKDSGVAFTEFKEDMQFFKRDAEKQFKEINRHHAIEEGHILKDHTH